MTEQLFLDPVVYDSTDFAIMHGQGFNQVFNVSVIENGARGGETNALQFNSNVAFLRRLFDNRAAWAVGIRIKITVAPSSTRPLISFQQGFGTQLDVRIGNDLKFRITRDGIVLTTTTYTAPLGDWIFVEFGGLINNAAGTAELRVNESTKALLTGVNTNPSGGGYANAVQLGGVSGGMLAHDINMRGGAIVDFWGDTTIIARFPDEDGDFIEFEGSDGDQIANFALVANNPHLSTDYVFTDLNGQDDLYEIEDIARVRILGVQDTIMANMDQCYGGLYPLMKAGGIVYQSALAGVSETKAYILTQYQNSPNTGQAWQLSELNRAQPGQRSYATATISGFVFYDASGDGIYDPLDGDEPFYGMTLRFYLDNGDMIFDPGTDTLIATLTADNNGYYHYFGVNPGSVYWIFYSGIAFDPSTPNPIGPITATAECVNLSDFGLADPPG